LVSSHNVLCENIGLDYFSYNNCRRTLDWIVEVYNINDNIRLDWIISPTIIVEEHWIGLLFYNILLQNTLDWIIFPTIIVEKHWIGLLYNNRNNRNIGLDCFSYSDCRKTLDWIVFPYNRS